MEKQGLKERVFQTIDQKREELIALARELQQNPELGFHEQKTAELVKREFQKLDLAYEDKLALTGVKAKSTNGGDKLNLCVMGEMDALPLPEHCKADKATGCAHACGHHAQLAMMLGCAMGFVLSGVDRELGGRITYLAVPAEELVDLSRRRAMRQKGQIVHMGGKGELIRLGALQEQDLFLMMHAGEGKAAAVQTNMAWNGASAKVITFTGKSAHAGKSPELGINALNAATAAMNCIHMLRETFRDEDHVRVHYILREGGETVNIVPQKAVMELFVRAGSFSVMEAVNRAVKRAVRGAAYAMGCEADILELGGYLPLQAEPAMSRIVADNADALFGAPIANREPIHSAASTDVGDVSALKPIISPTFSGFRGELHSAVFDSCDDELAYIVPAKVMAATAIDLLFDHAQRGKAICEAYRPLFQNREDYEKAWDELNYL